MTTWPASPSTWRRESLSSAGMGERRARLPHFVVDLVAGSGLELQDRTGHHHLKGIDTPWQPGPLRLVLLQRTMPHEPLIGG